MPSKTNTDSVIGLGGWLVWSSLRFLALVLAPAIVSPSHGAQIFPDASWETISPQTAGWNPEKLESAHKYAAEIGSTAVMIVQGGRVVASWGPVDRRMEQHSVRKSLLSALYGIYAAEGKIEPGETLLQLGLDDNPPRLTDAEKQARVVDLLMARSGVYHVAAYETVDEKRLRPERGSHPPGTFWYYNNWDFNALGAIFQQKSGLTVYEAFEKRIARPIEMEDFRPADGKFVYEASSRYPAYTFRMTARDAARVGLLYLRKGAWKGRQLIPSDWIAQSTSSLSDAGHGIGYGFLWWASFGDVQFLTQLGKGSFSARGNGGNFILVVPAHDLVIVHEGDLEGKKPVSNADFGQLLRKIMEAAPAAK